MANYVNSQRFCELILLAQKTGKPCNELADIGGKIGQGLIKKYRFRNIHKDEAYSIGALVVCQRYRKFKVDKGKPFNFFTTIILNEFRASYRDGMRYDALLDHYAKHLKEQATSKGRRVSKSKPPKEAKE